MIRLVFTDIDGVWTDDTYYYNDQGSYLRKFSTKDSAGLLLLNYFKVKTIAITGDISKASLKRFKDLNISVYSGIDDKLNLCKAILNELGIPKNEVLYVGNDINDMNCLRFFDYSYCPSNSPSYVKHEAKTVLEGQPGNGFFRDVVEHYLKSTGISLKNTVNDIVF